MNIAVRYEPLTAGGIVDPENTLTPRQLELLALYASGYDYSEIGSMKFLSPHTVKWHLARALARSHARNLTHLCAAAAEAGMLRRNQIGHFEPVQDLRVASD